MKVKLLLLLFSIGHYCGVFAQVLYSSTTEVGSRFNPGVGQGGTAKVAFDDVSIDKSLLVGSDYINVTKVKVGVRRTPGAPATDVKIYYTPFDDTSTQLNTYISVPPVLLGTVSLPANGSSLVTTVVAVGDSVSTLFKMKTDTGKVYPGLHTFFIGASLSSTDAGNALRFTAGPEANKDAMWVYNADSAVSRFSTNFKGNPITTFFIQVFGKTQDILPVTLSSFTGEQQLKGSNLLHWTTETELNNKGFELQRSTDGFSFNAIGFVASKAYNGSSSSTVEYQYTDVNPSARKNYYRLKQVNKDEHSTLSGIVLLDNKLSSLKFTSVYPNPAKSILHAVLASAITGKTNISIIDLSGKTVLKRSETLIRGTNFLSFNVASLSPGIYTIKVVDPGNGEAGRSGFIKQ